VSEEHDQAAPAATDPVSVEPAATPSAAAGPGPTPGGAAAPSAAPADLRPADGAGAGAGDSTGDPGVAWGRVADDGTVYVRTGDGETAVGSWLAGDPADGLAFYERRYQSLAVDIDLLSHRITDAHLSPDEAMAKIGKLRQQVDEPQCVGDLAALRSRLDELVGAVDRSREERSAARQAAKEQARAQRVVLVEEAERLAESSQWKSTGDRFRTLVDEWKAAPRLDRHAEQELWARFSAARATFDRRRRTHFAELDTRHKDAAATKAKLVKEAQELATSTDWGATSRRFRDLMQEWKAAGPAGRPDEERLWSQFRAAQDTFFEARSTSFAERDAEFADNLTKKLAILDEAERLLPVSDPKAARQKLRALQDQFAAAGMVPRADKDRVEGRMKAVEQAVRTAEESQWRRSNPEGRARAQAAVDQLESSLTKLRSQLATAEAAGDERAAGNAREAIEAREGWLTQAQQALHEFGG
jgi:hypothetical protein